MAAFLIRSMNRAWGTPVAFERGSLLDIFRGVVVFQVISPVTIISFGVPHVDFSSLTLFFLITNKAQALSCGSVAKTKKPHHAVNRVGKYANTREVPPSFMTKQGPKVQRNRLQLFFLLSQSQGNSQ